MVGFLECLLRWQKTIFFQDLRFGSRNSLISLILSLVILGITPASEAKTQGIEDISAPENLAIFQENTLLPIADHIGPGPKVTQKIMVIATAYSSTPWQTDDDPYITAAGTSVRDGIIANNLFSFGTKIRIPELYGDKVFIVEDRMNLKKSYYHIDIWFPSYWEAKNFGAKTIYIEILES